MEHEAPGYGTRDTGMGQGTPGWDMRSWDGTLQWDKSHQDPTLGVDTCLLESISKNQMLQK